MRRRALFSPVVSLCLSSGIMLAQKPEQFRVRVEMVLVPVAVTDREGRFVKDLRAEDFALYEDGVEQAITFFAAGSKESWVGLPPERKEELSGHQIIGLILDASGSMQEQMSLVRQAAVKFLRNIPRTEHLFIIDFDENIRLSDYSSDDQRQITERLYGMEPQGWTALYDAVAVLLERAQQYDGGKTLVIFTDGVDTRSALDVTECLEMVKASDVTIHSIHFASDRGRVLGRGSLEGSSFLRRVADLTGGSYVFAPSLERLDEFYDRILDELFSQYTLGYVSSNTKRDGRYRTLEVEVRRPKVKVRHRRGYQGPTPESPPTLDLAGLSR